MDAYLHLPVPADAPFELKPSPIKGWGVFATRRIEQGAAIFKEKPLFVIPKPFELITGWDVRMAFQKLPPRSKQNFLRLRNHASGHVANMESVMGENSFQVASEADLEKGLRQYGMFLILSRMNHSCVPNAKLPLTTTGPQDFTSYAVRDIAVGEEITMCYKSDFEGRPREERHLALQFECHCKACQLGTPYQRISDIRRRLIRAMQYLRRGKDLDGRTDYSRSPVIADPKLKRDAETFNIPLTSRLVYALFRIYLLEQEGLLDQLKLDSLLPTIRMIAKKFRTEENARIARLALAKGTWLESLCAAFEFFGRPDKEDARLAASLRALHNI
ncbi:hypothetical protein QQX98_002366 [Neonectria punicea]|uniref:SET domain-containing protein n=1 Tax=Neonectria punicea TaxID=979145 RepID=A0ABR1HJ67_9HYPO